MNEALKTLQEALAKYVSYKTEDGPWIQIGPDSIVVVDCFGCVMYDGNNIQEATATLDALV